MALARQRAKEFCDRYRLETPILQAPMAGACPPELAAAVAAAGGMGAAGVVLDDGARITDWVQRFRAQSSGAFQLNAWIPDEPVDDPRRVATAAAFLGLADPSDPPAASGPLPAALFDEQCEAMLRARPTVVSSIMGLFDAEYVAALHEAGIAWFACATTLADARAAQDAGADAVVAQGIEAGGHQGTFRPGPVRDGGVGGLALVPQLADHLSVPVIAAGGIADGRGLAAALTLGASAVQVGSALLRCPETGVDAEWAAALPDLPPEAATLTAAYSGRVGRAVPTDYVRSWRDADAPRPAPYPQQRRLVAALRKAGGRVDRVNQWAGQHAGAAREESATTVVASMWRQAQELLP